MGDNYSRLLRDEDLVEHFLEKVLRVDYKTMPKIIKKIVTSEKMLLDFKEEENTLVSTKHRDRDFKSELQRWDLRKTAISELFSQKRPNGDDEINLGNGGALPNAEIKREQKAFILIGPPASGKSSIADTISEDNGAIILDSDYAKRKLPEFEYDCGATLVQEESNRIIFGFPDDNPQKIKSLYQLSLEGKYNIVVPKIGQNPKSIIELAKVLTEAGYEVHLLLVSLKRREATIRALTRFSNTQRYVPLGFVFDQIGNDPLLSYYIIKEKGREYFKSMGVVSTDVDFGDHPKCIDIVGESPASKYEMKLERFF